MVSTVFLLVNVDLLIRACLHLPACEVYHLSDFHEDFLNYYVYVLTVSVLQSSCAPGPLAETVKVYGAHYRTDLLENSSLSGHDASRFCL